MSSLENIEESNQPPICLRIIKSSDQSRASVVHTSTTLKSKLEPENPSKVKILNLKLDIDLEPQEDSQQKGSNKCCCIIT